MLLESKNGLLVKFDQYMYQRETYMYIVKQNKNFVTTTYQEKNHSLNLEKKYISIGIIKLILGYHKEFSLHCQPF